MGKNTQPKEARSGNVLGAPMDRQFSSGGVVYKNDNGKILWFVTKSTPSKLFPKSFWRLPKGWIDNDSPDTPGPMASGKVKADEESLQKAALREVSEEGGIQAKIVAKIGTSTYFLNLPEGKVMKFVTFYLMEWVSDLPEGFDKETSETDWLSFEEAYKKLSFPGEKSVLKKAKELLHSLV